MIISDIHHRQGLTCDICIIGSGPAGATIAEELAGSRLDVVVVESGGRRRGADTDALNEIESIGAPRQMEQWLVRNRILGGTSHSWTGRCAPLDPSDYAARPSVPQSGWPFGPEEVGPYLDRAAPYLGLGPGRDFSDERFWAMSRRRPPKNALDPALLTPFFWQFSRDCRNRFDTMRFAHRLDRLRADNLRVLTGATACHIDTLAGGRAVGSVEVADAQDQRRAISAKSVVLCAGGIENARLLLVSNRQFPAGLGNANDLVGRYLMDHPRGSVARLSSHTYWPSTQHFGFYTMRSQRGAHLFCQGIRLSPAVQQKEGLLNAAAWLSEFVAPDDPWSALQRILRGKRGSSADAGAIARHLPLLARGVYHHFGRGDTIPRKLLRVELNCAVEQRPDPDSRVMLSDRMDRHAMPLSRIDWRVNAQEQHTARRLAQLVAAEFVRLGLPAPVLDDWVLQGAAFPPSFRDVAHPIGTTRMADDPKRGVVDRNCAVHGIAGLYVAGSSVFPTAGHANPTLMIVALAVRLADRIKLEIAKNVGGWKTALVAPRREEARKEELLF